MSDTDKDTTALDTSQGAEMTIKGLAGSAVMLARHLDAVSLFGMPALERVDGDEFRFVAKVAGGALERVTWIMGDLERLISELGVLTAAAERGERR